jgi:hypothetical protein
MAPRNTKRTKTIFSSYGTKLPDPHRETMRAARHARVEIAAVIAKIAGVY